MATWRELSLDNLEASKALLAGEYWRSSISRSYYAAYCAVSQRLAEKGVRFARGWNNPAHDQLLALIRNGLTLPPQARHPMAAALRRLRLARESADYRPGYPVEKALALASYRDAGLVLRMMEE